MHAALWVVSSPGRQAQWDKHHPLEAAKHGSTRGLMQEQAATLILERPNFTSGRITPAQAPFKH